MQQQIKVQEIEAFSQTVYGHFIYYKVLVAMLLFEVLRIKEHGNIFKNT